jgi:hypothetical protein
MYILQQYFICTFYSNTVYVYSTAILYTYILQLRVLKLSSRHKLFILVFGILHGRLCLLADVSEHLSGSITLTQKR